MQGQRNSMEHFTDVFGFDIGSSSGNPVMDQQAYWNNVLGSVESQNLQGYQMNRSDATIPYGNEPQHDGTFLGFWESGEASSSGSALNYGSSSNAKTEHLSIGGGLRIGERRLVADNDVSLDVDINLNANINDLCSHSSNVNRTSQGPDQYGGCGRSGINAQPFDRRLHPYRTFLEQTDSFNLNASENPLGDFSFMQEGIDQRPGSSLDGRRLACKRKNIEGANGQSSASASTSSTHRNNNALHNIASSSYTPAPIRNSSSPNCLLVPRSIEDQLPRYGTNAGLSSGSYDLNEGINNAGNPQRSFRARTTTTQQIAPCTVWPSSNAIRLPNSWNHHQSPHLQSTFDDPQEVIPVVSSLNLQYQHPVNVPGVPQAANRFTGHGASSSRAGSLENRILSSEEVPRTRRNVVPTNYSDLVPPAAVDLRRLVPEPPNWISDGRGTAISGTIPPVSRANTSSTVNPPAGFTQQNINRRHPRNMSEEISRLSGALRGHQPPRLRSGFLLERQGDGVWGVPLSMRGREGRRLMEIRNALEMIQRGENVRLEELLALEERIGNVSTGLSEEAVIKLLKQRKFSSWRLKASFDHEPCCICQVSHIILSLSELLPSSVGHRLYALTFFPFIQEEYVDGDDLGRLDCGHDFHAVCIKQWLVLKNVCPICKNTALKT
nr:unnamed protein product [Digitaria exilis]